MSLPSAASAIVTPKCLFVFSNIIVIFLANESKLSPSGTQSPSSEDNIDVARHQPAAFTLVIKGKDGNHAAEEIVKEEQEFSMAVVQESLQQLVQCDQKDASSTIVGVEELREYSDISVANFCDGECMEVEEQGRVELREETMEEEDSMEEEMGLPTDELNRRVEDFIARFNMERQLEARMLVCCC